MTEMELRQAFVDHAKSYLGVSATNNGHKVFVDIYNNFIKSNTKKIEKLGLPRKSYMSISYAWCACFASAMAIEMGYGMTLIPIEMSCTKLVAMAKEMGIWEETDSIVPAVGDLVLYVWSDGSDYKTTDAKGNPDHIGIVSKVSSSTFEVVEGNRNKQVSTRLMNVNGRYIRGFIRPKFDSIATSGEEEKPVEYSMKLRVLSYGCVGNDVKFLQTVLNGAENAKLERDGKFGPATKAAVVAYQKKMGLPQTGIVDKKFMTSICGI